jgi:hypothetical protein
MISETDVLYKDIDEKGKYFYQSKKHRVAVWMINDKVFELSIGGYIPFKAIKVGPP